MRRTGIAVLLMVGLTSAAWADETATTTMESAGGARIGIRANGAKVIGDASDAFNFGFGFAARGGWEIQMGQLGITPELMISWDRFGASDAARMGGLENAWILGVMGGARLGYTMGSTVPWLETHFGLAHANSSGTGMVSGSSDKFGVEIGAGLDYMVSPAFGLGVFFAWNLANTEPAKTQWLSFGLGGTFGL